MWYGGFWESLALNTQQRCVICFPHRPWRSICSTVTIDTCRYILQQWRRAITHEKQTRKGGAPQGRIRTWRVLNTCARKQLSGWKNAYSPRRSRWRCFQVFHYIWQVCNWPVDLLFHLLEAALDNALASLSLFLVLHLYPPVRIASSPLYVRYYY